METLRSLWCTGSTTQPLPQINAHFLSIQPSLQPQDTDNWHWTSPGDQFSSVNEHKKQVSLGAFSPANHSDCQRQTPFIYENSMSVIFFPRPTQMTHTHTHFCWLHYRGATDQLSCWIPNRTYPINLSLAGITDWYWGRETINILRHTRSATKTEAVS